MVPVILIDAFDPETSPSKSSDIGPASSFSNCCTLSTRALSLRRWNWKESVTSWFSLDPYIFPTHFLQWFCRFPGHPLLVVGRFGQVPWRPERAADPVWDQRGHCSAGRRHRRLNRCPEPIAPKASRRPAGAPLWFLCHSVCRVFRAFCVFLYRFCTKGSAARHG
jgi:hypothetical protein